MTETKVQAVDYEPIKRLQRQLWSPHWCEGRSVRWTAVRS
jgi:hypothetical protein